MCEQCVQTRAEMLTEIVELRRAEAEIIECYALLKAMGKQIMEWGFLERIRKGDA